MTLWAGVDANYSL